MLSSLIPQFVLRFDRYQTYVLATPSDEARDQGAVDEVLEVCAMLLKLGSWELPSWYLEEMVDWYLRFPEPRRLDPYALAVAVASMPGLVHRLPELADPHTYDDAPGVPLLFELTDVDGRERIAPYPPEERTEEDLLRRMAALLDAYRWNR